MYIKFANLLQSGKVSVIANNLDINDYVANSKVIFGIQKQSQYKLVQIPINSTNLPSYIADYSAEYNLYFNNAAVSSFSAITSLNYGTNTFVFKSKNNFVDVSVSVCYVAFEQAKTSEVVEIDSQYNFVASEWINIYGANLSNFDIQSTINTVDFSTEGKQYFTITITIDQNQIYTANCEIFVENQRVIVENINQTLFY